MKTGKMKQLLALLLAGMLTVGPMSMPVFGTENGGASDFEETTDFSDPADVSSDAMDTDLSEEEVLSEDDAFPSEEDMQQDENADYSNDDTIEAEPQNGESGDTAQEEIEDADDETTSEDITIQEDGIDEEPADVAEDEYDVIVDSDQPQDIEELQAPESSDHSADKSGQAGQGSSVESDQSEDPVSQDTEQKDAVPGNNAEIQEAGPLEEEPPEESIKSEAFSGSQGSVSGNNAEIQEAGPLEEEPPEESIKSEAFSGSQGSVSGSSKVTWSNNTMPASFDITSSSLLKRAYLTPVQDGYMRVAYNGGKSIIIEYYDTSFQMTKQGRLSMELGVWGGFFKGEDAYYVAEGQYNTDCVDGTEVLRIVKYDFDWNRIGAGNILAKEGWEYEIRYPFKHACVNMDEVGGKLYLVTGREGYVDDAVGQGHQGMMLIRMDEETFDTEIVYGNFGHSFAQYIGHSGTDLYICEQSEGGRETSLSRFDSNRTGTDYFDAFSERFSVLDYGGIRDSTWAIPCYASVDDMAISSDNILCLGTSIDQSQYDNVNSCTAHNIYLTVTPKSGLDSEHTTVRWLTDFSGDGKTFIGVNITRINNDRFLIAWEESPEEDEDVPPADYRDPLSSGELHYILVDGSGNEISDEFTASAMISDCHPVLKGSQIVYYASNANCLDFYTINAQTGAFKKYVNRTAGDNVTWDYKDGTLSFSGKGAISLDLKGAYRYPVSDVSSGYSYYDSDNCWKYIREKTTDLSIGKGITSIPEMGFAWFDGLTSVKLPAGLKTIGKQAFYSCDSMVKLIIPSSVNKIGDDILWTGFYWGANEHVVYAKIYGYCTSYGIEYAKNNDVPYHIVHNWDPDLVTTKATTTKNGSIAKKCTLCGKTSTTEVIYYPKTITLSKTSFVYNGKEQKPVITVKGADGKKIAAGNYTLKYSTKCKTVGIHPVKIVFKLPV